jgi:transcriptional regulator with XRE-family HTH domain
MKSKSKNGGHKGKKDEELLVQLGERIKQLRIAKGYTSYEYFAYDHNISRAQYGRYEQGQNITIINLAKLANAFGITLAEFFSEGFD